MTKEEQIRYRLEKVIRKELEEIAKDYPGAEVACMGNLSWSKGDEPKHLVFTRVNADIPKPKQISMENYLDLSLAELTTLFNELQEQDELSLEDERKLRRQINAKLNEGRSRSFSYYPERKND